MSSYCTKCTITFVVAIIFPLFIVPSAQAQTEAVCSFKIFQLASNPQNPNVGGVFGVNDDPTVVGQATGYAYPNPPEKGFIRYSNGSVSYYLAPSAAATWFTGRNNSGINIGIYSTKNANTIAKGFMLNGSTFTSIVHPKAILGTILTGLNKYNSIVGWYYDANEVRHGFKRYSNGSFTGLNYPASGVTETIPMGINDYGTIVGSYTFNSHGFVFHNGAWATLDYPNSSGTVLVGISNTGVIVGEGLEQGNSFMYVNGGFKNISIPNAFSTGVSSISPDGKIIAGTANLNGQVNGWRGFTAACK